MYQKYWFNPICQSNSSRDPIPIKFGAKLPWGEAFFGLFTYGKEAAFVEMLGPLPPAMLGLSMVMPSTALPLPHFIAPKWQNFLTVGDANKLREMMLSIPMHMQNLHVFPDNESFVQCSHLALPQTGRDKKWLQPGSLVSTKPYH